MSGCYSVANPHPSVPSAGQLRFCIGTCSTLVRITDAEQSSEFTLDTNTTHAMCAGVTQPQTPILAQLSTDNSDSASELAQLRSASPMQCRAANSHPTQTQHIRCVRAVLSHTHIFFYCIFILSFQLLVFSPLFVFCSSFFILLSFFLTSLCSKLH